MTYEDLTYNDESIQALEKYMIDYSVILSPLDGHQVKQKCSGSGQDVKTRLLKRRNNIWICLQILMGVSLFRYLLLTTAHKENIVSRILCDTFRNFGSIPRTVFYASIVGQSLFAFGFNLITHHFEKRGLLDYMTDLKTLKGLSPENYKKVKLLSSFYAFAMPKNIIIIQLLYVILYSFGIYQG